MIEGMIKKSLYNGLLRDLIEFLKVILIGGVLFGLIGGLIGTCIGSLPW